ncbi:phosphorylated adapter RNA export protein-like [Uloborus diversus]|uniref:phosphorylated adapter RNA export protein-like n=1 Tax=Uloborus diversus TaxID=327109 RepID=UPI00240A54D1|nr:phosphorylated adapter RNA export protein-like [Uloborus diversus]
MELSSTYCSGLVSSSDSSFVGSQTESAVLKRGFDHIEESSELPTDVSKASLKKRKLNTWSDVLQDEMNVETSQDCCFKDKPENARGLERHDHLFAEEHDQRNEKKHLELTVEEKNTAKKIIRGLGEKKNYLICQLFHSLLLPWPDRVVKVIGNERALNLLKMTEDIEESGGMMIKNQKRRRKLAGVYFHLLKNDKDVTQEMHDTIFEEERSEQKKYSAEKRKAKTKRLRRN